MMMASMKPLMVLLVCALATSCAAAARELRATRTIPNLAVVTTGGTIATTRDANGQLITTVNGTTLLAAVPGLNNTVNITGVYAAYRIDSSTATPTNWRMVSAVVLQQLQDPMVDAVLITHGTDSMEQTAWFLQCIRGIGDQSKPVVLTGAMRGSDSTWPDGPENLLASATVAASPRSAGLGVLIVMADQVFSARFVTKVNANNLNAFGGTDGGGKIGNVVGSDILYYFRPYGRSLCPAYPLPSLDNLPNVALQTAYPGADGNVLDFYESSGVKGLVISGLGSGNIGLGLGGKLNSTTYSYKVVISRAPAEGVTSPDYGCIGCLGQLTLERGVVSAGNLNAFQARIVLLLALARNPRVTQAALQKQYDAITYPK